MVAPITGTNANPATATNEATKKLSSNFDTFLTLLTTQLKNQDPTSPMDSAQFTQQLVQFSQVEQQIDTNTNLKALIAQGQSAGTMMATSYLGRNVTVSGGVAALAEGEAEWTYDLSGPAANTQLVISDAGGRIVFTAPGETRAGSHSFTWDGKDANGNELPGGTYVMGVGARGSNGETVSATVTSQGVVSEVDMTGAQPILKIGPMRIPVTQVAALRN